jgi:hypothetical protein
MSYNDNYKIEVKEKYGETKEYTEYIEKTKNYSSSKWDAVNAGLNEIFYQFSIYLKSDISFDSLEVQELVIKLQKYITDNYYTCTDDILFGLSNMYVNDERFKNNIDKHLEGTAFYVMNAIKFKVKK